MLWFLLSFIISSDAAFAFSADILLDILAPCLLSLTPFELQVQSNTPTHWKSLVSVFPKHWSSSDRFEHRFLCHLSTSFNNAYLPSAPCLTLPSWDLRSINVYHFFVTLGILSLLSVLLSDLSYCFSPLQSFLDPQLFLQCLIRKSASWTHASQLHDNSYHHIMLVIFPICFASSSLDVPGHHLNSENTFLKLPCHLSLLQIVFWNLLIVWCKKHLE